MKTEKMKIETDTRGLIGVGGGGSNLFFCIFLYFLSGKKQEFWVFLCMVHTKKYKKIQKNHEIYATQKQPIGQLIVIDHCTGKCPVALGGSGGTAPIIKISPAITNHDSETIKSRARSPFTPPPSGGQCSIPYECDKRPF
eukprot:sb/3474287/